MENLHVNVRYISSFSILFLFFVCQYTQARSDEYLAHSNTFNIQRHDIVTLGRERRDVSAPLSSPTTLSTISPSSTTAAVTTLANNSDTGATNVTKPEVTTVSVTKTPLLGENGTGILKIDLNEKTPKVSDPINPDDNLMSEVFKENPERIKAEHNLTQLNIDNHIYYNSSFIGNVTYFNEYWANITKIKASVHPKLSNSHRRATTVNLTFPFPYYGHEIHNVTVASGGFIYTGEHTHNWLAATQYIAPLMGNFDTSLTNDSYVKLCDDGEKFTAFWENVTLQGNMTKKFTFAVTLYKNGDIVFAYKDIPIDVQNINDTDHPVKVGISDAYISEDNVFNVRSKKIFEYHRVSLKNHEITNRTILRLTALPTCLKYKTCDSCLNHDTGFNCTWCPDMPTQKCSSGTDRFKQNWMLRQCDKRKIVNASACATANPDTPITTHNSDSNVYKTDSDDKGTETPSSNASQKDGTVITDKALGNEPHSEPVEQHSSIGGAVAAFVTITILCSMATWVVYAFKNPHTRSGQLLIKYRPSQWNWRRGEARYTAATIHM